LWQYLRKEPAYREKAYAVLVNITNFTESFHNLARTAVTLFFLTMFAQLAVTIKVSKFWKSRLRQTLLAPKLNPAKSVSIKKPSKEGFFVFQRKEA
jgi:hypothetical protein